MMRILILFIFYNICFVIQAHHPLRVMFWNTENLFDYRDDTVKNDNEFLPEAPRHWTFFRYRQKLIHLSKVIVAAGEGVLPALIGLCEVESDSVLIDLHRLTPFRNLGYRYLITTSPDERGINIALLYKRNLFKLIARNDIRVNLPKQFRPTRDILHVTGEIAGNDTLDLFICHFPSRSGGEKETRPARYAANLQLRKEIEFVIRQRNKPLILVMGDFNDYPMAAVQKKVLRLQHPQQSPIDTLLYNLMADQPKKKGSHKYDGEWGFLDQFFVNGLLLNPLINPVINHCRVFEAPFLLTEDTKYFGLRPYRTYYGYKYEGGFSDHLPILLDLKWE